MIIWSSYDPATNTNAGTLSGGNLTYAANGTSGNVVRTLDFTTTQKFYFTVIKNAGTSGFSAYGVVQQSQATTTPTSIATVPAGMWLWRDDAQAINNGSGSALGTSAVATDVVMVACDPVAGKLWFGKNGTWFASGDPAAGTNPAFTGLTGALGGMLNYQGLFTTPNSTSNYGATAFAYAAPTGFAGLFSVTLSPQPWFNPPNRLEIVSYE